MVTSGPPMRPGRMSAATGALSNGSFHAGLASFSKVWTTSLPPFFASAARTRSTQAPGDACCLLAAGLSVCITQRQAPSILTHVEVS